jgi:hypothetical protein
MVETTNVSGVGSLSPMRRTEELFRCLIKIVYFMALGEWLSIQSEDVIHSLTEEWGEIRDAPHFFPAMASMLKP